MLGVLCGLIGILTTSLPLVLAAVCVVDILRNDRPREWFWLVILIPIIGPLAYLANFYIVEGFGGRQLDLSWKRHRRIKELKGLSAVQDTAGLWLELGELHFLRKEWMSALKALQRSLDHDETLFKAQYYAGAALCEVARHEAALPHLDYVLEHEPNYLFGEAQMCRGRALEALGRNEEARAAYAAVVARNSYGEAVYRHAMLTAKLGDPATARTALERMVREAGMAPRRDRKWIKQAKAVLRGLA